MEIITANYFFSKYERKLAIFAGVSNLLLLIERIGIKNKYDFETFSYFFIATITLIPFGIFYKQIIKPTFIRIVKNSLIIRTNPYKNEEKISFENIEKINISKYSIEICPFGEKVKSIGLSNFSYQQRQNELVEFKDKLVSILGTKVINKAT